MNNRADVLLKRWSGLTMLGLFLIFSFATAPIEDPDDPNLCGDIVLDRSVALPLEPCTDRNECNEVCCTCADGETLYVSRGCDFESEVCFEEVALCEQALEDDPSLCDIIE